MRYDIKGLDQLDDFCKNLAGTLKPGDIVLLSGQLGAGKTTLTARVLSHLGVSETVNSPTFAILKTYDTARLKIHHMDAYRIDIGEAIEAGFDELFGQRSGSLFFIEWWQNIAEILPQNCIRLDIQYINDDSRSIEVRR